MLNAGSAGAFARQRSGDVAKFVLVDVIHHPVLAVQTVMMVG
jgi:hypothetical protein